MYAGVDSCLMPVVVRPAPVMIRGSGSYLWDKSGRRYLDFLQGWAVNSLGHCAPEVVAALTEQAGLLITPSPALHNAPQLELARRLCQVSGLHQAHFASTGAEANECAIKLARKWGKKFRGGAFEILCTEEGFHGRTLATMAASGKPGWDLLFPPYPPGFPHVPYGDLAAIERAIGPQTVGIMVEPIQGEAGVVTPPPGYLRGLRALADAHDLLLILDEVQTGMGRTGTLFAFEQSGILPDLVTLGKGIAGGIPLSAVLANQRASCFEPGEQGGTFNGNPLATAVGLAVLDTLLREGFLAQVRQTAELLRTAASRLTSGCPGAVVRGVGLLIAMVFPLPIATALRDRCLELGLLVNAPRPNVIRLMPSLRVSAEEIAAMEAILSAALAEVIPASA